VYGSPVAHTRLSQLGTEHARVEADGWMVHDLGLHLANDAPGAPACDAPVGPAPSGGLAVRGPAVLEVRAGSAPVTVLVRRLAERFDGPALGTVAPGVTSTLRIPADRSTLSWRVELRGSGADVARCR
jgi:hypothetical protein